jgi:hypothetical protein
LECNGASLLECSSILLKYCVLSDNVTASLDAFHKRMAKSFAPGLSESFSTGVSITDPRTSKVLAVYFSEQAPRLWTSYVAELSG